jgi:hypothetical protein
MTCRLLFAFAVLGTLCTSAALGEEEEAPKRLLSVKGAVDFTNAYVYRGYVAQDKGLITQPQVGVELNVPQLQSKDFVITPYGGVWASTSSRADSPEEPRWLYEVDYFAGARLEVSHFTLDLYFQHNSYPGKVWHSTNELDLTVTYDDAWFTVEQLKLPVSINPHLAVARAIDRSDNLDQGPDTYLELGIAPAHEFEIGKTTVTVSLPLAIGLGFDHYYRDAEGRNESFGYGSAGVLATMPLPLPKECGEWDLHGSVTYYRFNAATTLDSNHGNADKVVGLIGIGASY